MTTYAPRPVLVGIDGSHHSDQALDWAIAEATSRSLPLHLLHALETGALIWSPMLTVPVDDQRWILDGAIHHVKETAPDLPVTSAITSGPPSVALEQASADADTVVVGERGHGVVAGILLGSTSLHVANHAHAPVIVVREQSVDDSAPPPARRVVVGFDGSHLSDDALAYAFSAAANHHLTLNIVMAWNPDELATYQLVPSVADEVRASATHHRQELAAAAAAPWSQKYPEVKTEVTVTTESPAEALIDRSWDAALVVVGSRGLGGLRGALLGSVSGQVLRHAHSPVAIIRPALA
jgi:nucleotide-binding universal stress UspA family protein